MDKQRELTHVGLQRDLTHARGIFGSLVGSEQNLLGEEHFSRTKTCTITNSVVIPGTLTNTKF